MFQKYDASLKLSVVIDALNGTSLETINSRYASNISKDSLRRWCQLFEKTRSVISHPETYLKRGRRLELNDEERDFVKSTVESNPTIYLVELQQKLLDQHGLKVAISTLSNELHFRLNMTRKKVRWVHPAQDINERIRFMAFIAHFPPEMLVFVDECGLCLDGVQRTQGWAPIGQRTNRVPFARATHRFNLIAGVSLSGLVAAMTQEDSVERVDFEYYLEKILLPSMNPFPGPQSVLIMDNAAIHHNGGIEDLVNDHGCAIFYLPPYSPDLNPIEKGFSVLKSNLKRYAKLTGDPQDGEIIDAFTEMVFTPTLMRKLFKGSGYICDSS